MTENIPRLQISILLFHNMKIVCAEELQNGQPLFWKRFFSSQVKVGACKLEILHLFGMDMVSGRADDLSLS